MKSSGLQLACNMHFYEMLLMLPIFIEFSHFQDAHHVIVDDSEIIVDYNRQQLMPGWIPRRLGQLK